jgi:hypothetical protein
VELIIAMLVLGLFAWLSARFGVDSRDLQDDTWGTFGETYAQI